MYIWSYVILDLDISDLAWFHLGIIKYYFAGLLNYSTLHLGLHLLAFEKKKYRDGIGNNFNIYAPLENLINTCVSQECHS